MIEQRTPLGDAGKCVRTLIQIINYDDAFEIAADNLVRELRTSMRFHWRQLNPGNPEPDQAFVEQFSKEVINRLKQNL